MKGEEPIKRGIKPEQNLVCTTCKGGFHIFGCSNKKESCFGRGIKLFYFLFFCLLRFVQ